MLFERLLRFSETVFPNMCSLSTYSPKNLWRKAWDILYIIHRAHWKQSLNMKDSIIILHFFQHRWILLYSTRDKNVSITKIALPLKQNSFSRVNSILDTHLIAKLWIARLKCKECRLPSFASILDTIFLYRYIDSDKEFGSTMAPNFRQSRDIETQAEKLTRPWPQSSKLVEMRHKRKTRPVSPSCSLQAKGEQAEVFPNWVRDLF